MARNNDSRVDYIDKAMEELDYLRWMLATIDLGPAHEDVINMLNEAYEQETGNKVPEGWDYE